MFIEEVAAEALHTASHVVAEENMTVKDVIEQHVFHNGNALHLWPFGEVHLPTLPSFELFGLEIDPSITKLTFMMLLAAALLIIMAIVVRSRLQLVPRGLTNLVESFVLFIKQDVAEATMGHHAAEKYTPYLCTTFFFILTCNLLGLVPYGASATGYVSVTATLAFMSFLIIQYAGIRKLGIGGYLHHLIPPGVPWWLAPIMFVVELMGVFAKPFALCIRLFANMVAGHVVIISLIGLIFVMSFWVFPLTVAFCVFMYILELFVAFLQAYIFTMLTSLFMGLLVAGEH